MKIICTDAPVNTMFTFSKVYEVNSNGAFYDVIDDLGRLRRILKSSMRFIVKNDSVFAYAFFETI